MERTTGEVFCLLIVVLVGIAFVLDLIGVAWAMIRKKPYKSFIGECIEQFADQPSLFWLAVLIAIMYAYSFFFNLSY